MAAAEFHRPACRRPLAAEPAVHPERHAAHIRHGHGRRDELLCAGRHDTVSRRQVAKDVIASSNALVNGSTIAIFALALFLATTVTRQMPYARVLHSAVILSLLSVASLAIASAEQSLALYMLAQLSGGAAYSMLLLGGLSLINAEAPVTHRGATLSALFLVAYLAQAVLALALGKIATALGLRAAIDTGIAVIVVLALLTLLFVELRRRTGASTSRRNTA